MDKLVDGGQIDVFPRVGKVSGAYCRSAYSSPTLVLLNHNDSFQSYTTLAHELGHAIHSELSRKNGPIYSEYSMSLAETASTLFESIAFDKAVADFGKNEKIIALHDKINDEISTIFRQVACFKYEQDIHHSVREKGFVSAEELAQMHNRRMAEYLGPSVQLAPSDGYMFVYWSHIRRFFYVYSYAFGLLVSKALLRKYRQDHTYFEKIEKFLSAGGKDSPENILKSIDIDVMKPDFWREGLLEIEREVLELERLTMI